MTASPGLAVARYARALFEVARDGNCLDQVGADMERLATLAAHDEFLRCLADPRIPLARRAEIVMEALQDAAPVTLSAIQLLQGRGRLTALATLPHAFQTMVDQHQGRLRGILETAESADPALLEAIQETLSGSTGCQVLLRAQTAPSLLGGVRVTLGDSRWDGTLKGRLDNLHKRLADAEIG